MLGCGLWTLASFLYFTYHYGVLYRLGLFLFYIIRPGYANYHCNILI